MKKLVILLISVLSFHASAAELNCDQPEQKKVDLKELQALFEEAVGKESRCKVYDVHYFENGGSSLGDGVSKGESHRGPKLVVRILDDENLVAHSLVFNGKYPYCLETEKFNIKDKPQEIVHTIVRFAAGEVPQDFSEKSWEQYIYDAWTLRKFEGGFIRLGFLNGKLMAAMDINSEYQTGLGSDHEVTDAPGSFVSCGELTYISTLKMPGNKVLVPSKW